MTEEQKTKYNQFLKDYKSISIKLNVYEKLIVRLVNKHYQEVYKTLPDAIQEVDLLITKFTSLKERLMELEALGVPLKEIQMNKAVRCSYTSPIDGTICSSCVHACSITIDEESEGPSGSENVPTEYMLCNINDQAYDAHKEGYDHNKIIDVFGVHPEGRCKFQQSLGEDESPVDFDDYIEGKEVESGEQVEVPPEAPGGYVDEDDMEHGESSAP